jgi:GT2 family glycosyltransferase
VADTQETRLRATDLTLVVVAYHREAALARLLDSAASQAQRIVVVNVEDDPGVREVAADRGVNVLPLMSNVGYAAAVNAGVAEVKTALVAFANDDLELAPGCLAAMVDAVSRGADVAVPRLYRPDGQIEASIARLVTPAALLGEWVLLPDNPPDFLPRQIVQRVQVEKWRRPSGTERIDAAEAALVVARTAVLREHPLPEVYFLYWEEHEWFHRLRAAGLTVLYVAGASATHAGWTELNAQKSQLLAINAMRCLNRTGGRRAAALGWPVVVAWWGRLFAVDLLRLAVHRSPDQKARLRTRWAGFLAACGAWHWVRRSTC